MVRMRKFVLAGAAMSAAALTVASAGWACSPGASVDIDVPGAGALVGGGGPPPSNSLRPGDSFDMKGDRFDPGMGIVEIRWNSTSGRVLTTVVPTGPSFTTRATVPMTMSDGQPLRPGAYAVWAVQRKPDRSVSWNGADTLTVLEAPVTSPPPPAPASPTDPAPQTAPQPGPGPVPSAAPPETQSPGPVRTPAPAAQPAGPPGLTGGNATSPSGAPAAAPGAGASDGAAPGVPSALPAALPAAPTESRAPEDVPLPDPADLWSGISPGTGTPAGGSLLDARARQDDTGPRLGATLMTLGLVLGAGACLVASLARRRGRAVVVSRRSW